MVNFFALQKIIGFALACELSFAGGLYARLAELQFRTEAVS